MRVRLLLILALSAIACATAWADEQFQIVTPEWAAEHSGDADVRVLDVRADPHLYFRGHVPNAVHMADSNMRAPVDGLPVAYLPPEMLAWELARAGVRPTDTVVVYSDGDAVLGATMVAYALEKIRHPRVAIVDGGWTAYKESQPVTQKYPSYTTGKLDADVDTSIFVTLDQLKNLMGKPGVTIVDARPYPAYAGEVDIWMRNGHIPGAINVDWHTLVEPTNMHKFKAPEAMQAIFNDAGVKKTDDVIVYCGTSREATIEHQVLRHVLGYPRVRLYEGSWTQYSSTDLPMETGEKAKR